MCLFFTMCVRGGRGVGVKWEAEIDNRVDVINYSQFWKKKYAYSIYMIFFRVIFDLPWDEMMSFFAIQ